MPRSTSKNGDPFPDKYAERVYAGVLGKIIGVYLGRPIEGWTHERIVRKFKTVDKYLNKSLKCPLVVSDDDISGTFTFVRALEDNAFDPGLTAAEIGETWLNYIIEDRTILWWGGMGTSTEHTAYLRLKHGIPAPRSGSIELNGHTVAEQIGAQIFIEGWALVNPGDPAAAADFAQRAGSVSHDGEAIYGAQMVAAMTAQAFVESDVSRLLEVAVGFIPGDSIIAWMISDIRSWHASGIDWKAAYQNLKAEYGYDKYGGGCHMVPNHGVVVLALLFGEGDFSRSLMIANTCGWDTDCNSANVGCILGVIAGLEGIDAGYDWRGPIADRLFLPTADGGRCVTDAVQETHAILRAAYGLRGLAYEAPKGGARFSFEFPGSVQGFEGSKLKLQNTNGRLRIKLSASVDSAITPTFPSMADRAAGGYGLVASPTLYPGQIVRAQVSGATRSVSVALAIGTLQGEDFPRALTDKYQIIEPGETAVLEYSVPDCDGYPVTYVGLVASGRAGDSFDLDWLDWDGPPKVRLTKTPEGRAWKDAWVNAANEFDSGGEPFRLIQNEGTGLLIHGCREWTDLSVESRVTVHLVEDAGIAVRVQGLRRYYALRVTRAGTVQLVKCVGDVHVLAETAFGWSFGDEILFQLSVHGTRLTGAVNGVTLAADDADSPLSGGAIAFVLTEGRIGADSIRVSGLGVPRA